MAPDARRRLNIFAAQARAFGSEFLPANPSALYVSNAHAGSGNGSVSPFNVSSAALSARSAARLTATTDGPVLGRDHPRRELPVHGEHRQHQHLDLPDRGERLAALGGQHAFKSGLGIRPFRRSLDPGDNDLYVSTRSFNAVSAFAVRAPA